MILPTLIFVVSYAVIAARRLRWIPIGRPAGAVLGAVAMVASGVLTPKESYAAIDHDTIVLLFAMMLMSAYLERAGFFARLSVSLTHRGGTPSGLMSLVAIVSGALSALLVNDTVCVFFTPVVLVLCRQHQLPFAPYLIALVTSSNIGSAATLVGNPQNMIVGSLSGISFLRFLAHAGPAACAALLVNVALLHVYFRRRLPAALGTPSSAPLPPLDVRRSWLTSAVCVAVVIGFVLGLHLGYTALAGVLVLMLADREEPKFAFEKVDWTLIVFFTGLFVLVTGFARTGVVDALWARAPEGPAAFAAIVAIGSNLVSNVPMVLLTASHLEAGAESSWVLLAYASTVAGNLTLIGSAANIIVAERAKEAYVLGFFEYLRFGAVSCALSLLVGLPILWLMGRVL